ncbi:hypothetical protein [Planktothricoides raciborskii]|uniref:Uncharacterized protein n=1 Tax=Planktothricoides raciborskii GIHE-MW2 TaxID=2792601 RepID=A0AAU8JJ63_9CYAN
MNHSVWAACWVMTLLIILTTFYRMTSEIIPIKYILAQILWRSVSRGDRFSGVNESP